jgi:hypothetical protein
MEAKFVKRFDLSATTKMGNTFKQIISEASVFGAEKFKQFMNAVADNVAAQIETRGHELVDKMTKLTVFGIVEIKEKEELKFVDPAPKWENKKVSSNLTEDNKKFIKECAAQMEDDKEIAEYCSSTINKSKKAVAQYLHGLKVVTKKVYKNKRIVTQVVVGDTVYPAIKSAQSRANPSKYPLEVQAVAVYRFLEKKEKPADICKDFGIENSAHINVWAKKYIEEGLYKPR